MNHSLTDLSECILSIASANRPATDTIPAFWLSGLGTESVTTTAFIIGESSNLLKA